MSNADGFASWPRALARRLVWAPAIAVALGGGVVAGAVQLDPGDGARLAAVFPPWWSPAQAIAAAAEVGAVAGVSPSGFVIGVVSTQRGAAAALRARGALLVADGRRFPTCFPAKVHIQ